MKRILSLIFAFLLLVTAVPKAAFALPESQPLVTTETEESLITEIDPICELELNSRGAYMINTETETVLYAKEEDTRMYPASLTKIMTALVVLRECERPKAETIKIENVKMFDYIIKDGGVHMNLKVGETLTVYDLLVGLMISSFCDVGDLLAVHFGDGEISKFVDKMNDTAKELGMENTHFENPHGLHQANHYSTPRDMAILLRAAMQHPTFRQIVSLRNYVVPATQESPERKLRYTVRSYHADSELNLPCYVGGKSGFTKIAGRCLATYSEQDGVTYVTVMLGANLNEEKYEVNKAEQDTYDLLTYAYDNYSLQTVFEAGEEIAQIPIKDSDKTVSVITEKPLVTLAENGAKPDFILNLPEEISQEELADKKEVGSLCFSFDSRPSATEHSLVLSWEEPEEEERSLGEVVTLGLLGTAKIILYTLLFLTLLIITLRLLRYARRRHRRKTPPPKR